MNNVICDKLTHNYKIAMSLGSFIEAFIQSKSSLSMPHDDECASEMVEMMEDVKKNSPDYSYGAFLFGYRHLLPEMQGEALASTCIFKGMFDDGR